MSKNKWKKPIKAGCVCVYFFGSHNLGVVVEDRVIPARNYEEATPKKAIKVCPKFTLAVKELEDYSNKWTANKKVRNVPQKDPPSREASVIATTTEQCNLVTPQRPSSMKESPMFRLFYNGKLAGMHVRRREISLSEVANYERAEAEFEALVLGHEMPPSPSPQTVLADQSRNGLEYEVTLKRRNVTDEPIAKKCKLPPVGFIGLDFVLSRIMKTLVDKEVNVFVSHVTDVDIGDAVHATTQTVFSTCNLIFVGLTNKQLLARLFLSCDSSHMESISKRTSLVLSSKISPQMSLEIERKVRDRGGRFLDIKAIEMGDNRPIILAGGDKMLFEECRLQYFSSFATECKFFDNRQSVVLYSVLQFLFCISIINLAEVRSLLSKLRVSEDGLHDVFRLSQLQSSVGMQLLDSTLKTPNEIHLGDLLADVLIAKDYCDNEVQPTALIPVLVQLLKGFVADGKGGLKLDQLDERLFS